MLSMLRRQPLGGLLMLPLVLVGELLLLSSSTSWLGIGEAHACTGGAPGAAASSASQPAESGWLWLKPSLERYDPSALAPAVQVATDGFFVIDAEGASLGPEAAASMQVQVTDASGSVVAGETKLLSTKSEGSWYLFGWSAALPLPIGSQLLATLSATPVLPAAQGNVGGQFRLSVVGAPTPLPSPSVAFTGWLDFYHGEGGTLTCQATDHSTCASITRTIDVPASVTRQVAGELTWRPPMVVGGVAWSLRVEPSTSQADARVVGDFTSEFLGDTEAVSVGRVIFPTLAPSYCAELVLTDLRTSQQTRSETCAPPAPTHSADSDTALGRCDAPPSDTLRDAWCRLQVDPASAPGCSSLVSAEGNSAGEAGSGGAGDVTRAESSVGGGLGGAAMSDAAPSAAAPRTAQGCAFTDSAPTASGVAWLGLLGALVAGRARVSLRHRLAQSRSAASRCPAEI